METLLGHLAQFSALSSQGEILCTQGLAYLLTEHLDARSAFADQISARAGISINRGMTWHAEQRQPDRGRPDLEARIDTTPVVKIEAKLDAGFQTNQLRSYVSDLQRCLQGQDLNGVLVVLVPRARSESAIAMVKGEFGLEGPGPWRALREGYREVAIAVVSWDDVLMTLGRLEAQPLHGELKQFEGMYREFTSSYIAPLAGRAALVDWRNHEDDFVKLVDRVTRRMTTAHKLLPMAIEPLEHATEGLDPRGYNRRYVCLRTPDAEPPCFSIGVRDPFAGNDTPIWMRFHNGTPRFPVIRERLDSSVISARVVKSDGHVWIPLAVPLHTDSEQMVDVLVEDAEAILQVGLAHQTT